MTLYPKARREISQQIEDCDRHHLRGEHDAASVHWGEPLARTAFVLTVRAEWRPDRLYRNGRWAVSRSRAIVMKLIAAAAITYAVGAMREPVVSISHCEMNGAKPPKMATASA